MRHLSGSIVPLARHRSRPASHQDELNTAAEGSRGGAKRERTRARLLAATAKMLATNGYFGLRVADIAAAAGLSTAAFHLYFSGREEAAREVLAGLLRRLYIDVGSSEPDRARPFARIIRDHLAAIQTDAPLVQALDQAVQLDPVLAELSEGALRLWRARLTASPQGLAPTPFFIDAPSAPDVLDLILAGLAQTARTRLTTAEVSQLAADIARACRAAQSSRPPPLAFGGARAEAGSARA